MLNLPCPYCGPRADAEFVYMGDASVKRPTDSSNGFDDEWLNFVYLRENKKGPNQEYWFHRHGCRQLVKINRDISSNEILSMASVQGVDEK